MACAACSGCILIVDDDPDTLAALRDTVRRLGCSVLTARDGAEALAVLRDRAPAPPCLVLTDLNMPVLDGAALTRTLRRTLRYAETPVVTMSAEARSEPTRDVLLHLEKPFEMDALVGQIARLCRGGPARDQPVSAPHA